MLCKFGFVGLVKKDLYLGRIIKIIIMFFRGFNFNYVCFLVLLFILFFRVCLVRYDNYVCVLKMEQEKDLKDLYFILILNYIVGVFFFQFKKNW